MAEFRLMVEVKGHVYREINGQKYEFPLFTGKKTHAHTVPFLLPSKCLDAYKHTHGIVAGTAGVHSEKQKL